MNYKSVITNLYFILIHADGKIDDKELASGKRMIKSESMAENDFNVQMEYLQTRNQSQLYNECITNLRKLDKKQQIRIIAWLCVVANADGFMDVTEWKLIYAIYHKELQLKLEEIFKVQKELSGLGSIESYPLTTGIQARA